MASKKQFIFWNTRYVPYKTPVVPVTDDLFVRGVGIYDAIMARDGKLFLAKENLAELRHGVRECGMYLKHSDKKLIEIIKALLKKNGLLRGRVRIRITVTPGTFVVEATPLDNKVPSTVKVITMNVERPYPALKSTNRLFSFFAAKEALRKNAYETLLVNRDGEVTEGSKSNLFMVKRGRLYTPPAYQIHAGATRKFVIKLARSLKIPIQEKRLLLKTVLNADELFITGAFAEILPVFKVDTNKIGDGKIGLVTRKLQFEYVRRRR